MGNENKLDQSQTHIVPYKPVNDLDEFRQFVDIILGQQPSGMRQAVVTDENYKKIENMEPRGMIDGLFGAAEIKTGRRKNMTVVPAIRFDESAEIELRCPWGVADGCVGAPKKQR